MLVLWGVEIALSLELGSLALAAVGGIATLLHHKRQKRLDKKK